MKNAIVLFILIFISIASAAQIQTSDILSEKNERVLKFGLAFGINFTNLNIHNYYRLGDNPSFISSETFPSFSIDENSYLNARPSTILNSPGIKIGIVSSLRINENIALRFIPGITFYDNKIYFNIPVVDALTLGQTVRNYYKMNSTYIDMPLLIKYKNNKILSGKPYLIFGGSYKMNISKSSGYDIINFSDDVINAEIGLGLDKYLKFTRFAIELKACLGLNEIMDSAPLGGQNKFYSQSIKSIKLNIFTLSFMFD